MLKKDQSASTAEALQYWKELSISLAHKLPPLQITFKAEIRKECYRGHFEDGILDLELSCVGDFVQVLSRLAHAYCSGHLLEVLNLEKLQNSLRLLFISKENDKYPLEVSRLDTSSKESAKRVLELGYNALILDPDSEDFHEHYLKDLISSGLQVYIYNSRNSGLDFNETFEKFSGFVSGFAVKGSGQVQDENDDDESTYLEQIQREVKYFENLIGNELKLIYFPPSESLEQIRNFSFHFNRIVDHCGPKTSLAFNSYQKSLDLQGSPNPVWEVMRASFREPQTGLLPILNMGLVEMGEGLWPLFPFTPMDHTMGKMYRHKFLGIIALSNQLPERNSFLYGVLWVFAQASMGHGSAQQWMKTWLRTRRPGKSFYFEESVLKILWDLACRVMALKDLPLLTDPHCSKSEYFRLELESLVLQLNALRVLHLEKEEDKESDQRILRYFIRDMKKILLFISQKQNLSIPRILDGDDLKESFWTSIRQDIGKKISGTVEVSLLSKAQKLEVLL